MTWQLWTLVGVIALLNLVALFTVHDYIDYTPGITAFAVLTLGLEASLVFWGAHHMTWQLWLVVSYFAVTAGRDIWQIGRRALYTPRAALREFLISIVVVTLIITGA